eukprot:scaffold678_cov153-Chaetoceros_neogracile.AAC.3
MSQGGGQDKFWGDSLQYSTVGVGLSVFGSHRETSIFPFFFDTPLQAIECYSAGETTWLFYYY